MLQSFYTLARTLLCPGTTYGITMSECMLTFMRGSCHCILCAEVSHLLLAAIRARASRAACSGERVDIHKGLGGAEAGDHRPGRGEPGGRAVPEQPHGAALRRAVPGAELAGLHDRPAALPPGASF